MAEHDLEGRFRNKRAVKIARSLLWEPAYVSTFARAFAVGAVGPSGFYRDDWDLFKADENDEVCAALFGGMLGEKITLEEVRDDSYLDKMQNDAVPTTLRRRTSGDLSSTSINLAIPQ